MEVQGRESTEGGWYEGIRITSRWIYLLTTIVWLADAIATGSLFDIYMSDLARRQGYPHPNEFVGILESCRGITCLIVGMPLGYLFDRFDRLCVLRCAVGLFGLSAILTLSLCVAMERLALAVPGLVLYAVYFQAVTGSLDALLADAVPPAQRTEAYSLARTLQTASRALGPFLQALVLSFSPRSLSSLLLCGLIGPAVFLLTLWPLLPPGEVGALLQGACAREEVSEQFCGVAKHWLVPGLAMAFNLTIMLGGGISLKFFPIFYHQEYGLAERSVCFIMAGYWIMTAMGSYTAAFLPRFARRPTLVLCTQFVGASLLFLFATTKPLLWNLSIFEFRPLINNAHFALNTALTMEYALPRHRGKWASLGSLNRATFAGSALLGGFLTDAYSFRVGFTVTGCILLCGLVIYSPMLLIVRHA